MSELTNGLPPTLQPIVAIGGRVQDSHVNMAFSTQKGPNTLASGILGPLRYARVEGSGLGYPTILWSTCFQSSAFWIVLEPFEVQTQRVQVHTADIIYALKYEHFCYPLPSCRAPWTLQNRAKPHKTLNP